MDMDTATEDYLKAFAELIVKQHDKPATATVMKVLLDRLSCRRERC